MTPGKSEGQINQQLRNKVDEIPPAKIEDLVVMATDFAAGQVTFVWTATGDNYDEGKAHMYEIRWKRNVTDGQAAAEQLTTRHKRSSAVGMAGEEEEQVVVNATVDAGEKETVTLNMVPGGGASETFVVTIVASDDAGNMGEY